MTISALAVIQCVIGALCLCGAIYAQRRSRVSSAASVAILLLFMAVWALGSGLELCVESYAAKRIMLGMSYIGIGFLAPTWIRFILEHNTHRHQGRNPLVLACYVFAAVLVLANWYNPGGGFYRRIEIAQMEGGAQYLAVEYGPLFWTLLALNYGALAGALISMWYRCARGRVPLRHVSLMTGGVLAPFAFNALYITRVIAYDATPIGFFFSAVALALLHKNAFFSELPISRRKLFEAIGDGIILLNSRQEVVDINPAAMRMLGLSPGPQAFPSAQTLIYGWRQTAERASDTSRFVQPFEHPTRGQRYFRISFSALESRAGGNGNSMLFMQDETALYQAQERIRYLENYDSVTGMMGRQFFTRLLSQELELCGSLPQSNAVLCVSVVNYSDYCHIYGGDFGEALQREVGIRMQSMLRKHDAISRFSEDEFYLCFRYEQNAGDPKQNTLRVIDRMTALFSKPIKVGNTSLAIRLRAGAAFCPLHGSSADKLIAMSKMAQMHASKAGGQLYYCYDEDMGVSMSRYLRLEQCLHTALDRGELYVVYHPQVDIRTGQVAGVEALLRWDSPELGSVPPGEFISVAEDTGDIRPIGMWVIQQAVAQAAQWVRMGIPDLRVAVNVSLSQLISPDFSDSVISILDEHQLPPGLLEVEITESMALSAEALSHGHLPRLRRHGVRLAMDDFGMGHSSLSYIKQFDLDTLKIDRVLSQDMLHNPTSVAMIRSVQLLCQSLGIDTVVEYVEHQEQLDLLAQIGCDVAQGYFFSEPLRADACSEFIMGKTQSRKNRIAASG